MARVTRVERALGPPRRLPDLADRRAERRGAEHRVRGVRRLRDVPRQPRGLVRTAAAVADVGGDDGRRHLARLAVRRLAGGGLDRRGVRDVCPGRSVGGEHADAGPHARGGRPLAPRRDPARHPQRALEPVLTGDHARSRRNADRACVRVSDPGRGPVLGGCRRGGRVDDDLCDPAGRPHHRARDPWRGREHGRGRHVDGRDPRSDAVQGAASAVAEDDSARRQPDDHVRPLHGRHRRSHRRRRARRRRHQRAHQQPGARRPRRCGDRRHGDGPRPLDRGRRRPHRPRAPAPDRGTAQEAETGSPSRHS